VSARVAVAASVLALLGACGGGDVALLIAAPADAF
jgi:hypothetical protein